MFRIFVTTKLSKIKGIEHNFSINISGTSSFLIILNEQVNPRNFRDLLIENYRAFVKQELNEFMNSDYYQTLDAESKRLLDKWLSLFNPPFNPKIIVSYPYQSTLFDILQITAEKEKNVPLETTRLVFQELNRILHQKIKIGTIKLAYLFEASGYNEGIVKEIEDNEQYIYATLEVANFLEFLSLKNPTIELLKAIAKLDFQLSKDIRRREELFGELDNLIRDLKLVLFEKSS